MSENPRQMQPAPTTPAQGSFALPFAALVVGAVAMGSSPIFVRLADVGPFTSAFWRMALAIPVLWLWLGIEKSHTNPPSFNPARDWKLIAGMGFFFAGDLFFWHLAIVNTSVANATLLATMTPLAVAFGAWLFLKEKITRGILAGVASGVLGACLLVGASQTFAPENVYGDIAGLITACFFGSYFLTLAFARRRMSPAQVMFYPSVITAGLLLVTALLLEDQFLPHSLGGLAALGALALISHVGGQGFTAYALGHLPVVFSSLVIFIEVLAAASMAWVILSEPVTVWQLGGGLLILAGIYVARPKRSREGAPS